MRKNRFACIVFSWILVLIILCFIFGLSAQNAEDSKELSDSFVHRLLDWLNINIDGEALREIAHMLEFTSLSFSFFNAIYNTWEMRRAYLISLVLTVVCAFCDEIHQIFVPGRAFQISDILIDSIGAIVGVVAYLILYKLILILKERGNKNGSIETI